MGTGRGEDLCTPEPDDPPSVIALLWATTSVDNRSCDRERRDAIKSSGVFEKDLEHKKWRIPQITR